MTLSNYDFNGFAINLYVDEQGDWLAHFQEFSNISAFGDTPQQALEELKIAWELLKEDYQEKGKEIPVAPARKNSLLPYKKMSTTGVDASLSFGREFGYNNK